MIEMYSMRREGEKTYSEGSKLCTCTEMKRMLWSGQRHMNGVSDRLQIERTSRTACQKIKLRDWLIFTVCHILERFRNFSPSGKFPSNVKTRGSVSFFLMNIYIYYFLVAKSMLCYCWRKATEYRVSSNKRPRCYHVNQAPQFSLSSLS